MPTETLAAAVREVHRLLHRLVRQEGVPTSDIAVLYGARVHLAVVASAGTIDRLRLRPALKP